MFKFHRKRRLNGSGNDLFNRSQWGFVDQKIKPDVGGRIKYQSSWWPAKEINNQEVCKGKRVLVVRREGIFMLVKRCL
jgi:membrane protein implicated in regulation of membrane protease activity